MFFIRLKIFIISMILLSIFGAFILYMCDIYIKKSDISAISAQLNNATIQTFETANQSSSYTHNYSIIKSMEQQRLINSTWISSSKMLSNSFRKNKQALRDTIEKKVYVSKQQEIRRELINTNEILGFPVISDEKVRISSPVIIKQSCLNCHVNNKIGEVVGSTNVAVRINGNLNNIFQTMKTEFIIVITVISLLFTTGIVVSSGVFTKIMFSIKNSMQHALSGNFSYRAKRRGFGIFDETINATNKLLDVLDKGINSIDARIATIFIYQKSLYSKNPLNRIIELIAELAMLFAFKTRLETLKDTKEVYRELQNIISKYIRYQSLIFIETLEGEITFGHKTINNEDDTITVDEIKSMEERINFENRNVLFDDKNGCVFVSTSNKQENVIDIKITISSKIILYYSLIMANKKDLIEKEKSVSRIYNYIREFKPLVNNIILLKNIEEASYTDQLTKAYNRLYLEKYTKYIEEQLNKGISFGVLMIDIDHFKKVNDTYGHNVGDAGIVMLTESIMKVIRPVDKVFRYGGEEFGVLLEGVDIDESYVVAERIRSAFQIETRCSLMELTFPKSASIGISSMPVYSRNIWECINQADMALYEAKKSGRNRTIKYSNILQNSDSKKTNNEENDDSFLESLVLNS